MRQSFDVGTAQDAHEATNHLYQHFIKPQTLAGARGRVIWEPIDTLYRHQLRKLFHGAILDAFAWQVRLPDPEGCGRLVRFTPAAWKAHLSDLFCPARFDKDGAELAKSTEALTDEEFSEFIVACESYGVVDCGIEFPEKEAAHAA